MQKSDLFFIHVRRLSFVSLTVTLFFGNAVFRAACTSKHAVLSVLAGAAVFTVFGSSERQDFSNNEPFAIEANPAVSWVKQLPFFNTGKSD